jgi:hypothetical protein
MAISRMQMNRQLYAGGGIMDVTPRENFGWGSKFKRIVRKVIPNEISKIAVKAAPFVAPFNPLIAAGMAGLGGFDQTGSISKSLRSGALTYGLGQVSRYLGGAGFQQGINPFAGADFSQGIMSGLGSLGSSPIGTSTGLKLGQYPIFGGPQAVPEGTYLPTDFATEALPLEQATQQLTKTTTPGYTDLFKKVLSPQSTLGERTSAITELGGKALKSIYTKPHPTIAGKTILDKTALAATVAGVGSYLEAKKLAEEAELVDDADEYTEEMYEADKAKYTEEYEELLNPDQFYATGGRIGYQIGGLGSLYGSNTGGQKPIYPRISDIEASLSGAEQRIGDPSLSSFGASSGGVSDGGFNSPIGGVYNQSTGGEQPLPRDPLPRPVNIDYRQGYGPGGIQPPGNPILGIQQPGIQQPGIPILTGIKPLGIMPQADPNRDYGFNQYGFDSDLLNYLNQQKQGSFSDRGISYKYDPTNQMFSGGTFGAQYGNIPLSVLQQVASGDRNLLQQYQTGGRGAFGVGRGGAANGGRIGYAFGNPEQFYATGGRVKLETGGIPSIMLAKKEYNFMDLIDKEGEDEYYEKKAEELDRKYNPERYKQILPKEKPMDKYMLDAVMSEKGMRTLSEETRDDAMKMYAERAYKKGQISEDEYREIMGFKIGGRVGYKDGPSKSDIFGLGGEEGVEKIGKDIEEGLGSMANIITDKDGNVYLPLQYLRKFGEDIFFGGQKNPKLPESFYNKLSDKYIEEMKKVKERGYEKGGRVGYKIGSKPKEDEEGIMSVKMEMEDEDKENMMMADAPGITFTTSEKSYLFKTLAGQGGSDRSFTIPQLYGILNNPNSDKNIEDAKALKSFLKIKGFKTGGRVQYAMGSEVPVRENQAGVSEMDFRETGGFVPPIGVKEKADDIPAMLSNNEFVFTADAVRAAGGGSVNKGAQKMYALMKQLEGKVI